MFYQTRTYYIVREGRIFEINQMDPLTQLNGVNKVNKKSISNLHCSESIPILRNFT